MILMIVLLILGLLMLLGGFAIGYSHWDSKHDLEPLGAVLASIGGLLMVVMIGSSLRWYSSSVKAELLNNKFGTNYTTKAMFWSESTVNSIIEGTVERQEITGDLNITIDE